MKKIVVFLYAYKSKALRESVDSLLNNHSGSTILSIYVYDKNNLNRSEYFKDVTYEHVVWDSTRTKFANYEDVLSHEQGDFFFSIDGAKKFIKDWDIKLIELANKDEILSGINAITFNSNSYKFFVDQIKNPTIEKINTNWIDRSFIFTNFELFKSLPSLTKLKYRGEEEVLSLYCFAKNIKISAIPSEYVLDLDKDILSFDYIPFSINHNYNTVIDIFKNKDNVFFNEHIDIQNFENKFNYSFSSLSYHPFQENDIEYDPSTSLDDIEGERFFGGIKSIY